VCRPYRRHVTVTSQLRVNQWVAGVAVLGDKIYVVCDQTDMIDVYQRDSLQPVDSIKMGGLQLPNGLAACCQSRQLYVMADLGQCVWRVSADDCRATRWIPSRRAPDDVGALSLSVTSRQVLVTSYRGDALSLFAGDGRPLARVELPGQSKARHAVQTSRATFVVCRTLPRHDVIEMDAGGHVIRVYGGELNWPRRLAAVDGDLIVTDSGSGRVLVVD